MDSVPSPERVRRCRSRMRYHASAAARRWQHAWDLRSAQHPRDRLSATHDARDFADHQARISVVNPITNLRVVRSGNAAPDVLRNDCAVAHMRYRRNARCQSLTSTERKMRLLCRAEARSSCETLRRRHSCSAMAISVAMIGHATTSEIPAAASALASKSSAEAVATRIGRPGAISCSAAARSRAAVMGARWPTTTTLKRVGDARHTARASAAREIPPVRSQVLRIFPRL